MEFTEKQKQAMCRLRDSYIMDGWTYTHKHVNEQKRIVSFYFYRRKNRSIRHLSITTNYQGRGIGGASYSTSFNDKQQAQYGSMDSKR